MRCETGGCERTVRHIVKRYDGTKMEVCTDCASELVANGYVHVRRLPDP